MRIAFFRLPFSCLMSFLCLCGSAFASDEGGDTAHGDAPEAVAASPAQSAKQRSSATKRGEIGLVKYDPDDPRGQPELVLCSQNLNNLGSYSQTRQRLDNSMTLQTFEKKRQDIATRFISAGCDIIAVQELLGPDEIAAKANLEVLARILRIRTGRIYEALVGKTNDPISQVAILYATDRMEALTSVSYNKVILPKILSKERPRYFLRGPLEVQFRVRGRGDSPSKIFTVVNYHLKSKGGRERDPAALEWETYRMQMAEAIRRIVESRHAQSFASGETLLALVGDRNSNFDSASADILSGTLTLEQFQKNGANAGPCRLTQRGVAYCSHETHRPMRLFSVFLNDPQSKLVAGTFQYQQKFAWLDDILMPHESLRAAWANYAREGDYASFVLADPAGASDHSLVGVSLNW